MRRRLDEQRISNELSYLKKQIDRGEVDHIPALDAVIEKLNSRGFPDQGFAAAAREVVQAAQSRRQMLIAKTLKLLEQSPPVRSRVEQKFPQYVH